MTTKKDPIFEFEQKKKYEVPSIEFKVGETSFIRDSAMRL